MRKLIILAALVACCTAAPSSNSQESNESREHIYSVPLHRPSPINPDVLSDPKPQETVVKITDPKEAAKYKRETQLDDDPQSTPLLPTVLPAATDSDESKSQESEEVHDNAGTEAGVTLNRQKRDEKAAVGHNPAQATTKKAVKKDKPEAPKPARRQTEDNSGKPQPVGKKTVPAPETVKHRRRRHTDASSTVAPVPLIYRNEDKVSQKSSGLEHELPHQNVENHQQQHQDQHQQSLQAHQKDEGKAHLPISRPAKRDIPVPLVPKYHHPEESPKSDEKKDVEKDKKDDKEKGDKNKNESAEENQTHKQKSEDKQSAESKEHSEEHTPVHHALHPSQTHHPHDFQTQQAHAPEKSTVEEHKGEQQKEAASDTSTTSTEHPVLRHKPVPVAELFSRPRQ